MVSLQNHYNNSFKIYFILSEAINNSRIAKLRGDPHFPKEENIEPLDYLTPEVSHNYPYHERNVIYMPKLLNDRLPLLQEQVIKK